MENQMLEKSRDIETLINEEARPLVFTKYLREKQKA